MHAPNPGAPGCTPLWAATPPLSGCWLALEPQRLKDLYRAASRGIARRRAAYAAAASELPAVTPPHGDGEVLVQSMLMGLACDTGPGGSSRDVERTAYLADLSHWLDDFVDSPRECRILRLLSDQDFREECLGRDSTSARQAFRRLYQVGLTLGDNSRIAAARRAVRRAERDIVRCCRADCLGAAFSGFNRVGMGGALIKPVSGSDGPLQADLREWYVRRFVGLATRRRRSRGGAEWQRRARQFLGRVCDHGIGAYWVLTTTKIAADAFSGARTVRPILEVDLLLSLLYAPIIFLTDWRAESNRGRATSEVCKAEAVQFVSGLATLEPLLLEARRLVSSVRGMTRGRVDATRLQARFVFAALEPILIRERTSSENLRCLRNVLCDWPG